MPICQGNIVLVLDTSGSMSGALAANKLLMSSIPDNFLVGDNRIQVSLIFIFSHTGSVIWNLDSDVTKTNDQLRDALNSFDDSDATGGYIQLDKAFSTARDDVFPNGQSGAPNVFVLFWDGDLHLSQYAASIQNTTT